MVQTDINIAVVGLGYVGLPLAVALAARYPVVGFDISAQRVASLKQGIDSTHEVDAGQLAAANIDFTSDASQMKDCNVFIVTVPTPIDDAKRPDFTALLTACALVGPNLSSGDIVVFESTVYPGVTEEICGPELERCSGLKAGEDFKLGYSPERINPGDKERPIHKIMKVVSGGDSETLQKLADIYGSIIEAGIHCASSIKVAEAAKVIENTQRDLNIALMNEISKICDLVGIRTNEVLAAAGTKWNFLKFHPGLVGGHCIGVDPYYLTAKAEQLGYQPQVILSGRRINDGMGAYIAQRVVKLLARRDQPIRHARVGILGLTFKENVPDIRNSKVVDILDELRAFGIEPIVHDPVADARTVRDAYGVELCGIEQFTELAAIVAAVAHDEFAALDGARLSDMIAPNGILVDVRSKVDPASLRPDVCYWSL
jgi:UDP-N-acetyl-D-galactosamine dehydrogenase